MSRSRQVRCRGGQARCGVCTGRKAQRRRLLARRWHWRMRGIVLVVEIIDVDDGYRAPEFMPAEELG